MSVKIVPLHAFKDNYIWMLLDEKTQSAVCVDPGEAAPVIAYLKEHRYNLTAILITHHHWDHTNGLKKLVESYEEIPVFGPANSTVSQITHPVSESDNNHITLPGLKDLNFTVLNIPGHTKDHIAYYDKPNHLLFCGDTLFAGGCGRVFEGTDEEFYHSLKKLAKLPKRTLIYCGHEYTEHNLRFALTLEPDNQDLQKRIETTSLQRKNLEPSLPSLMKMEHLTNPFLRCGEDTLRQNLEKRLGHLVGTDLDIFTLIRKWKNQY